jgi:hypothetical protein
MNPEQLQVIDFNYAVLCRFCGSKVLDPDKKNNQQYLNCRCCGCGKDPKEEKAKKKFQKKNQKHGR